MAGNRNLMNHCRNESSGIERYIGTSYDHLVKVSENMDTINFIAANIDSILEGVIITQGDIIGQIQEEGKNMLEGIQKDMQDYVTKFEKDIDIIIDEKFSFIDETLSGIIHDSEFAIKQREFEARIGEVEIIIANEKEANASTRKELEVKYEDNRAKIEMLDQVIATNEFTMSEFYKKVELEMNGNTGRIEDLSKAIVDNEKAWLEKSSYLEGVIGENTAYIKDVQNVLVESNKAIAESLTELDATVGGFSAEITSVKKVTADLEKAQAEMSDRLSTTNKDLENTTGKVDELSSEILLERLTETTNTQTATTINSLQNSVMGANTANISLQQMTLANESEVRASQTTFLTAGYNDNTANLLLQQTVVANEVSTRASEHRKLTAHFLDNVAELESFKTVYASDKEALAESLDTLKAEVNTVIKGDIADLKQSFNSEFTEFKKTYATDKQATAESLENLKSELNTTVKGDIDSLRTQVNSEIETVKGTIAEVEKTSANLNTTLKSELETKIERDLLTTSNNIIKDTDAKTNAAKTDAINESKEYADSIDTRITTKITAEIKQVNQTIATVDGQVSAMTKLTAETTVLGERVISGLAFGSDGKQANFKIFADNFAIVSTDGRVEVPAFTSTMVGGKAQVGINGDLFVKGSIDANIIKANTILSAPTIQGGEMYLGNGRFEVNKQGEVKIRADATKNVGLQITNERIDVYDENGILRVRMGRLR